MNDDELWKLVKADAIKYYNNRLRVAPDSVRKVAIEGYLAGAGIDNIVICGQRTSMEWVRAFQNLTPPQQARYLKIYMKLVRKAYDNFDAHHDALASAIRPKNESDITAFAQRKFDDPTLIGSRGTVPIMTVAYLIEDEFPELMWKEAQQIAREVAKGVH